MSDFLSINGSLSQSSFLKLKKKQEIKASRNQLWKY